jgi:hypothetical protein
MKPPARPASPAPRQTSPTTRPGQPAARATQAAPRPAPARAVPRERTKLIVLAAVLVAAVAVVGYSLSRPNTPWIFDTPEAQKPYGH